MCTPSRSRQKTRRNTSPKRPRPHARSAKFALRLLQAETKGLLTLLHRASPQYAARYDLFLRRLQTEYTWRWLASRNDADEWILEQLGEMRLPNLREENARERDRQLLREYDTLTEHLA